MKIILVDEEAYQYMDMRDDIDSLNQRITELLYELERYEDMELVLPKEEPVPFYDEQSTHEYPSNTTREEHTSARWSDYDRARITSRIFLTGTYYGIDREFSTIRALFPERTEAAVKAMIYTLGGIIKKGIVHPRIQPKVKNERD